MIMLKIVIPILKLKIILPFSLVCFQFVPIMVKFLFIIELVFNRILWPLIEISVESVEIVFLGLVEHILKFIISLVVLLLLRHVVGRSLIPKRLSIHVRYLADISGILELKRLVFSL